MLWACQGVRQTDMDLLLGTLFRLVFDAFCTLSRHLELHRLSSPLPILCLPGIMFCWYVVVDERIELVYVLDVVCACGRRASNQGHHLHPYTLGQD